MILVQLTEISLCLLKPPRRKLLISGSNEWPSQALSLVRCFSFWGCLRQLIRFWQRCDELPDLSHFPLEVEAWEKPVTPVVAWDWAEQTQKESRVCAATLCETFEWLCFSNIKLFNVQIVTWAPLLAHPVPLTLCLLRHRFGTVPLVFFLKLLCFSTSAQSQK